MEQNTPYGNPSGQQSYAPLPPSGYPANYNPRMNSYAIVALVCAFVISPLAIIFGHLSLRQIAVTGEQGRGLAIAGLLLGYLSIVALVAYIVLVVVLMGTVGGTTTIEELGRG